VTPIEVVAVVVTVAAVWLTTRQVIWCWPLALLSVTLYAVVFLQAKLYADMGLQVVYFVLALYGWWAWLHGGEDRGELRVTTVRWPMRFALLGLGAAAGLVLGLTLERFTNASLPFMDSTLSSFSIIGQWLQTRKILEAWLLWIAVDVFYVGMFIFKGLYLTAGLYALFLYLAAVGFLSWRRSMKTIGKPPRRL
jgi:nicotinamide mononucleotide transporter